MIMSGLMLTGTILPAAAQTSVDQGTTTDRDDHDFPWGILGLLGLAGLLGRKRDRTVAETRRA
jgi:MYXO-CTERM domain-containing protein